MKRQETVARLFKKQTDAKSAQQYEVFELVQVFAEVNIPLEKLDHPSLKTYLQTKVPNLGFLPSSRHLRADYLDKVFANHNQNLKELLRSADGITVVADEASDSQGRFVLHILLIPWLQQNESLQPYLDEVKFLKSTNATTVSQSILTYLAL